MRIIIAVPYFLRLDGPDSMDISLGKLWENWRWTGRPGVLQSVGLPRVRHSCVTELNFLGCCEESMNEYVLSV